MFDELILENDSVELGPGDALVFYTDGITETRAADGALFRQNRLRGVLGESKGQPPNSWPLVSSTLLTALATSSGTTPPFLSCKCPVRSATIRASELRAATGLTAEASAAQLT